MKKLIGLLIGLALIFSLTSSASALSLLTNGSFEVPVVQNSWQLFSSVPSWDSIGPQPDMIEYQTAGLGYGSAADGDQWVELDSDAGNGNNWLGQSFTTEVDHSYRVQFAVSARPGVQWNMFQYGAFGNSLSLTEMLPENIDGRGISETAWKYYRFEFVADSNSTIIAFRDGGMDDGLGSLLDDVSATLTPMPEPATMVLFGMGLLGVAGIGRRKVS